MNEVSRTTYILRNARTSLLFSVVVLTLGFFSRKIFIDSLGIEIMGLNATVGNLLGLLNLAELGIGSAVSFTLYVPLFRREQETINEIVAIQGWLYHRIGWFLLAGSAVLMCFFPWIFAKTNLPLWYAYATFGIFLLSIVLGYFINYSQIILSASQQEYKITTNAQTFRIIKQLLQIIGLGFLGFGYIYWLVIELTLSIVSCVLLNRTIQKNFPWLHPVLSQGRQLATKHPQIIQKTKQIFFHKMAGQVLAQTSPLVIYAFLSLTTVAIYGNYMMLITSVSLLLNPVFNGMIPSIGNLVAEGNRESILSFFKEYTVGRYWLASVVCFCFYNLTEPFISLWLGAQYLLDATPFILLVIYAFVALTTTNNPFLSAYGLCHDIYAPITEATLNIGLSIGLGYYWGLSGILTGVLISRIVILLFWKPYFLCTNGLKIPLTNYYVLLAKILILIVLGWSVSQYLIGSASFADNYPVFAMTVLKTVFIYGFVSLCLFEICSKDFRNVSLRVWRIINIPRVVKIDK